MQEAALLVCGACMVDITKKYRPIRYGSESLQPKYFAWRDQAAISFHRNSMHFCIWITSIYSKLHLRIVKVYNLEEINILLQEFSWKHDTSTSLPLPLFQVRIAPEDWLPYSQRSTQFPSNLEIYVWRYSFFHQKIIAMVVCTFPCKLNKSCFWIVRNLYNIKQASGALCWYRCMCMWIQWNSVIVLLSVYEIWERSVRVSCFTRYPHRNTS